MMKRTIVGIAVALLLTTGVMTARAQELLVNGNFDSVVYATNDFSHVRANAPIAGAALVTTTQGLRNAGSVMTGWSTTVFNASLNAYIVEVWNGTYQSPNVGPGPFQGSQYVEMNSHTAGSLLQTVTNTAQNRPLTLSFAHSDRGNDAVTSTMRVTLFDLGADGAFNSVLATPTATAATLGGDDRFLINQVIGPVSYNGSANPITNNWTFYQFQTSSLTGNNLLLAFQSITSGSEGNFLDRVSLTAVAPEPGSLTLVGGLLPVVAMGVLRRRSAARKKA